MKETRVGQAFSLLRQVSYCSSNKAGGAVSAQARPSEPGSWVVWGFWRPSDSDHPHAAGGHLSPVAALAAVTRNRLDRLQSWEQLGRNWGERPDDAMRKHRTAANRWVMCFDHAGVQLCRYGSWIEFRCSDSRLFSPEARYSSPVSNATSVFGSTCDGHLQKMVEISTQPSQASSVDSSTAMQYPSKAIKHRLVLKVDNVMKSQTSQDRCISVLKTYFDLKEDIFINRPYRSV